MNPRRKRRERQIGRIQAEAEEKVLQAHREVIVAAEVLRKYEARVKYLETVRGALGVLWNRLRRK